jgi:hypothetical protein
MWKIPRWYGTSATEKAIVWKPYIQELSEAFADLRRFDETLSATRDQVKRLKA